MIKTSCVQMIVKILLIGKFLPVKNFRRRPLHAKYCMHSTYVYRPILKLSLATKIRLCEHFAAEIINIPIYGSKSI